MKPSRPYLLRALYEWVLDNNMTPHIAVDATLQGVQVPEQFIQDGQITLNIAPGAVQGLLIDDQGISFSARFGGVPMNVYAPMVAVLAIFTRENGMGMGFGMEPGVEELLQQAEQAEQPPVLEAVDPQDMDPEEAAEAPRPKSKGKPSLRVVK
ncbi:ClpXP protease specificity-enhancing factor [Marinobacterium weihaiense]|uniref:ClpXP protease specificity-enhancing factor n=1 Tax=Marinobacterium weihaiense TaxID=2851016 RepID=A0ABS6MAS6_9GAMM|nr:ClpXP protease specificity-enhancing factor [Marinobacterium weihaiense]MBV0933389.1 ClpXP protease specificity-enhancing factor [Marinobacterium weihaiense]